MEDQNIKDIIINLAESTQARGFATENQLHVQEMEKGIKKIEQLIDIAKAYYAKENRKKYDAINYIHIDDKTIEGTDYYIYTDDRVALIHNYNTIGVFGDRGSGKTSFMVSLLEECNKKYKEDVMVLQMIDPTLVEQKKPMVLVVLGMIKRLVENRLNYLECDNPYSVASTRQAWNKVMKNIAIGIIAIENVNRSTYDNSLWGDEDYVQTTGFNKVSKANEFERYIREMLTQALAILDKKAFILAFDDIDVDVAKGWEVLESIRRYFSDPRIISIVSGNVKLYGMIVRDNLSKNLTIKGKAKRETMANELESQYLLKILRPENRLNLVTLKSLLKQNWSIKFSLGKREEPVADAYREILMKFGINDTPSQSLFISFLESMSLRSQINFVRELWENDLNTLSLYVFYSRLYAAGVDLEMIKQNGNITNIVILNYLISRSNLPDAYLLLPTFTDKDLNSNFVALTFLECMNFKNNPHLMIDYLLRIGYLRNLILPMTDSWFVQSIIKYAGWNQIMSLKNNVGLTLAFIEAKSKNLLKGHISLYGLDRDAKSSTEKTKNAIDRLLEEYKDDFGRLLALFPFIRISNSTNNNGKNFYSIFALLAAIGEILKCESEEGMQIAINNLQIFRTYPAPAEGEGNADEVELGAEIKIDSGSIEKLAKLMWEWKENAKDISLPPYAIGRIATRLYNAVVNVAENTVGASMNIMVCDFLNACVIEESRVKLAAAEQAKLNNNNPKKDSKIFIDNLKQDIISKLNFSKWMMACPMLNCFVESAVYGEMAKYIPSNQTLPQTKLYDLLNKIDTKDKPAFSGSKTKWKETMKRLMEAGYDEKAIEQNIINAADDEAGTFILSLDLFKSASHKAISDFKTMFIAEKKKY